MNITKTTRDWASATDKRIEVKETTQCYNHELCHQTNVQLEFRDPVGGNTPFMEIWIPHTRRTPMYFYGPDEEDESDYFLPDFTSEEELKCALDIVYRRFMTDHGMMRYDDDPWAAHGLVAPDIAKTIRAWAKSHRAAVHVEEADLPTIGAKEFVITPVWDEVDVYFRVHTLHNIRQSVWFTSDGCNEERQCFPPFITQTELDGFLNRIIEKYFHKNKKGTKQ